jgi:hypothetical protein
MAMKPTPNAAPSAPMPDDADPAGAADDAGAAAGDDADTDAPGDEDVLLTVCKEADGTYSLIKGDEEDADGADAAGSATDANKQTFDSVGALLKAILDILNEDKASGGDADDQFQAGFDDSASPKPASPMAQKY